MNFFIVFVLRKWVNEFCFKKNYFLHKIKCIHSVIPIWQIANVHSKNSERLFFLVKCLESWYTELKRVVLCRDIIAKTRHMKENNDSVAQSY